jgi:hypothetical protein
MRYCQLTADNSEKTVTHQGTEALSVVVAEDATLSRMLFGSRHGKSGDGRAPSCGMLMYEQWN